MALKLIEAVEAAGGRICVDGEDLVIRPREAAIPVIDELRRHKSELIALLQSREKQETEGDALGLWLLARCCYRDGCWSGVGALYLDLARWCAEHSQTAPESRLAFTAELQVEGFTVASDWLVYGLMLAEDAQAHERFQAAPEVSGTPQRATAAKRRKAGRRQA